MNESSNSDFHQVIPPNTDDRQPTSLPAGQPQKSVQSMNRQTDKFLGNLLVVDDIEMNRDSLSRRMTRSGHTVKTAENGTLALQMLAAEPFDLVLLDVMMPGLSGLEVLAKIRETQAAAALPVIMATAKTASEDIATALRLGANDYVTKPINFAVVRTRVQTQLALKRASENLAAIHAQMKKGLDAAAKIQWAGMPREIAVPGYEFAWRFLPSDKLAGDGLSITPFDEQNISVCAWEVGGHGVPAALGSVSVSYMLNPYLEKCITRMTHGRNSPLISSPVEVATRLNNAFQLDGNHANFLKLCYGILESSTGRFKYSNMGLPDPIHVRNGEFVKSIELSDSPIGVLANETNGYSQAEIELLPGDRLYIFSDGATEAGNATGNNFGISALHDACQQAKHQSLETSLESLVERLANWHGSTKFDDDVSIIAIERSMDSSQ